jgi:hypothetical protein
MIRKIFQRKKILDLRRFRNFPADLLIFREIHWEKNGCQTGAMSTSSGFHCLFKRTPNRCNVDFQQNAKSAGNAQFLAHFQQTEQGRKKCNIIILINKTVI